MGYFFFLTAHVALILRPGDVVPALGALQPYLILISIALVLSLPELQRQFSKAALVFQPTNICVIGLIAAVVLSSVTNFYVGAAVAGLVMMLKTTCYYLLLISLINTPQRFRRLLLCTALAGTGLVFLSVRDFHAFVDEWSNRPDLLEVREKDRLREKDDKVLHHIVEYHGHSAEGDPEVIYRMSGFGIFHDPNDLALMIAVTSILCMYFLFDGQGSATRFLWIGPLILMVVALDATGSRGGLLAGGVGLMVWLAMRFGRIAAIGIGMLGAAAVPVVAGRLADLNISSGSGQERIQLWSDGLVSITGPRALFGIGHSTYADVAGLVAHNSYVHAFVELGFFGGTFFFGCFFIPALAFFRLKNDGVRITEPDLKRLLPYIPAVLAAWAMGLTALSRCYTPTTYMVIGMAVAYLNLVARYREQPAPIVYWNGPLARKLVVCSFGLFIGCFLFVRLFVRWS